VLDAVVHRGLKSHTEVAAHLGISKFLVSYIFDILKEQGCIQTVKAMGDVHEVLLITAEGRKAAGKPALEKQNEPSIREVVEDLVDTIDISEKANKRNRVLLRVYQESNGNPSISVSDNVIVEKEGVTHEELMQEIQPYLQKRGLIKFQGFKATAIDDAGIDKVERELLAPARWPVEAIATSEKVDFSFIADSRIKTIVERDYIELKRLDPEKTPKAVLVLSGAIIEAVLFDALVKNGKWTFEEACERPFKDMIHPAKQARIISHDNITDVLRVFRNLVHIAREIKDKLQFDNSHAKHALTSTEVIINEVRTWHTSKP
jgi:hypothetical protein